jgi:formamidopyrimidine-DNA glycosylase
MPELPDITIYLEAIDARLRGQRLRSVELRSPFVLRSALPPISSIDGCSGKRALTDARLFSGIGNAYSDVILHAARLPPIQLTAKLSEAEI